MAVDEENRGGDLSLGRIAVEFSAAMIAASYRPNVVRLREGNASAFLGFKVSGRIPNRGDLRRLW